jgi:hypothetical protein
MLNVTFHPNRLGKVGLSTTERGKFSLPLPLGKSDNRVNSERGGIRSRNRVVEVKDISRVEHLPGWPTHRQHMYRHYHCMLLLTVSLPAHLP